MDGPGVRSLAASSRSAATTTYSSGATSIFELVDREDDTTDVRREVQAVVERYLEPPPIQVSRQ